MVSRPELSIQENCWHSEGNGQSDFGFFMDGHYHSLIVLTRWPRTTYPGIIQRLTNLRLLDYTITVNVDPLPITAGNQQGRKGARPRRRRLRQRKENLAAHGDGEEAEENSRADAGTNDSVQRDVHHPRLGQDTDGLNAKAGAIKNAINSMNAAQYFESNLPSTSKNLFFQTWPGWTWGRYEHRKLYAEHRYLADMLPVTSTFTGHLAGAEAIYDGPARQPGRHRDLLRLG